MDGYEAAWAMWKVFANNAQYKAVRHHTSFPDLPEGLDIYIVDFCYSIEALVSAAQRAKKIVVLDHHISAQKDVEEYQNHSKLPANLEINFDQNHSGCMIVWRHFQEKTEPPTLLLHIEDHDLWRHQLAKTEAICKALYLRLPIHFSGFEKLKLTTLQQEGALLVKQQQLNVSRLVKTSHTVKINQKQGLAANAPPMFSSDLGHALAKKSGSYGLVYYYHGKRQCYECGLRSIGDFDVSELAQKLGGGGHKNAAGFRVDQTTFLDFMDVR